MFFSRACPSVSPTALTSGMVEMPAGSYWANAALAFDANAWHAATRPCSALVLARAGKPITSPTA